MYPATRCCLGACVQLHPAAAALEQGRPWPWRRPAAATQTSTADSLGAKMYLGTYWARAGWSCVVEHEPELVTCAGCGSNAPVCSPHPAGNWAAVHLLYSMI